MAEYKSIPQLRLGDGFDPSNIADIKPSIFKSFTTSPPTSELLVNELTLTVNLVEDISDLLQNLEVQLSVAAQSSLYSASADMSYSYLTQFNRRNLYVAATYKIRSSPQSISDLVIDPKVLKIKDIDTITSRYGKELVVRQTLGCCIVILFKLDVETQSEKKRLDVDASIQGNGLQFSGGLSSLLESYSKKRKLEVNVIQNGGKIIPALTREILNIYANPEQVLTAVQEFIANNQDFLKGTAIEYFTGNIANYLPVPQVQVPMTPAKITAMCFEEYGFAEEIIQFSEKLLDARRFNNFQGLLSPSQISKIKNDVTVARKFQEDVTFLALACKDENKECNLPSLNKMRKNRPDFNALKYEKYLDDFVGNDCEFSSIRNYHDYAYGYTGTVSVPDFDFFIAEKKEKRLVAYLEYADEQQSFVSVVIDHDNGQGNSRAGSLQQIAITDAITVFNPTCNNGFSVYSDQGKLRLEGFDSQNAKRSITLTFSPKDGDHGSAQGTVRLRSWWRFL